MTPKERVKAALDRSGISGEMRTLYDKGLKRMTDDEASRVADQLESVEAATPAILEAVKSVLAKRRKTAK